MLDHLFGASWWVPAAMGVVGIALFISGNARQELRLRNAGIGVVVLALAVFLISYFVDTDFEKCVKKSRQIVQAVDKKDWETVRELLDPRATVTVGSARIYNNREQIITAGKNADRLKSAWLTALKAVQTDTLITVWIDAKSTQTAGEFGEFTIPSSWELTWQQSAEGWSLVTITLTAIRGGDVGDVVGHMPAGK